MIINIPEKYMKVFKDCPDVLCILIDIDEHHKAELTRDFHYKRQGMTLNKIIPGDVTYTYKEQVGNTEIGWRDEWLKP